MRFDHGELPPEFEEEGVEEPPDLEFIIEIEEIRPEEVIVEKIPEYVPMDDYLQKELERQKQEELGRCFPKRLLEGDISNDDLNRP